MNGYASGSIVRKAGSTTVGKNSGGTVWPNHRISQGGIRRVDPSSIMTYQSGWLPEETTAAWYGPKTQTGLIWNRPASSAITANTSMKKPPALAAKPGNMRTPTTLWS